MARQLERDARKWRRRLHQLRLDVLSVMPENWREDPDWVKLAENQKLTTKVGAGETVVVTRKMLTAAHGVTLESGDVVLSARLLERIFLAMEAAR